MNGFAYSQAPKRDTTAAAVLSVQPSHPLSYLRTHGTNSKAEDAENIQLTRDSATSHPVYTGRKHSASFPINQVTVGNRERIHLAPRLVEAEQGAEVLERADGPLLGLRELLRPGISVVVFGETAEADNTAAEQTRGER